MHDNQWDHHGLLSYNHTNTSEKVDVSNNVADFLLVGLHYL
mgnify:CR=1 FL=1